MARSHHVQELPPGIGPRVEQNIPSISRDPNSLKGETPAIGTVTVVDDRLTNKGVWMLALLQMLFGIWLFTGGMEKWPHWMGLTVSLCGLLPCLRGILHFMVRLERVLRELNRT